MTLRDITDWLFVQAEGKTWFGKPPPGWREAVYEAEKASADHILQQVPTVVLLPVYEFSLLMAQDERGRPVVVPNLKPPFSFRSIRSLRIPAPIWTAVGELSHEDQNAIAAVLNLTEEAIRQSGAKAAGLSIVEPGTKLPPFGGGPR